MNKRQRIRQLRLIRKLQNEAKEVSTIEPLAEKCVDCADIIKCPVWNKNVGVSRELPCASGEEEIVIEVP